MKILSKLSEIKVLRSSLSGPVGFVPTMGYLHEGHLSMVDAARKICREVFVSIYVNPTQFAPTEDLSRYPRDFERDCQLLESRGVDYIFFPSDADMYPDGFQTYVSVQELSRGLCGQSRPDHFRGVATVVLKLFSIVKPDIAFFGQKDAQQCAVIRRMVMDLNLDVEIRIAPIVRDHDGLALSSRNQYLSTEERRAALVLPRTLQALRERILQKQVSTQKAVQDWFMQEIGTESCIRPDYISVVHPLTLKEMGSWKPGDGEILVAAALWVGKTRLIDNQLIDLGNPGSS
jgi:pantoate--beta-alanine ligase